MGEAELIKIIDKASSGDNNSFEVLCNRYKSYIKNLSFEVFIQGSDYEDIIQYGYIGLWKGVKSFNKYKVTNADSFVKICIKRYIYTAIKNADRKKYSPLNKAKSFEGIVAQSKSGQDKDLKLIDIIGTAKSSEEEALFNIEQKNLKMRLNSAFRSLSDTERKCISMYVEGLKQREICKFLDLKPKQVDNALTRAKRVIKNKYNLAHYLKS